MHRLISACRYAPRGCRRRRAPPPYEQADTEHLPLGCPQRDSWIAVNCSRFVSRCSCATSARGFHDHCSARSGGRRSTQQLHTFVRQSNSWSLVERFELQYGFTAEHPREFPYRASGKICSVKEPAVDCGLV